MKVLSLILIVVSLAIIAACYYLWFSPIGISIGGILTLVSLFTFVSSFYEDNGIDYEGIGCLVPFFIVALIIVNWLIGEKYVISTFGGMRHLYADCKYMEGEPKKDVHKISSFIWGCFSECESCSKRHEEEVKEEERKAQEEKQKSDLFFIEEQIEELQEVRQSILDGEDIDVDDYNFQYKVANAIAEEAIEEYREGGYEP